jgi:ferredoxin/flavodoxin
MKVLICYYSGSGNTKLACNYLAKKITGAEFTMFNIVKDGIPDIGSYDVIGFATFTDFWGPPRLMLDFIDKIQSEKKPAFFIVTYGFMAGRTPLVMKKILKKKGFNVFAGFSFHTPESYPPMIAKGMGGENYPDESELAAFNSFIAGIDSALKDYRAGKKSSKKIFNIGLVNYLLPMFSRDKALKDMGEKFIDEPLCTKCAICSKGCPYGAITLDPFPVFDMKKCNGCWFCYNHCPEKAVYTGKFRNEWHYPAPNEQLKKKLGI